MTTFSRIVSRMLKIIELASGIRQVKPGRSMRMSPGRRPRKGIFESNHSDPPNRSIATPMTINHLPTVSNPIIPIYP